MQTTQTTAKRTPKEIGSSRRGRKVEKQNLKYTQDIQVIGVVQVPGILIFKCMIIYPLTCRNFKSASMADLNFQISISLYMLKYTKNLL